MVHLLEQLEQRLGALRADEDGLDWPSAMRPPARRSRDVCCAFSNWPRANGPSQGRVRPLRATTMNDRLAELADLQDKLVRIIYSLGKRDAPVPVAAAACRDALGVDDDVLKHVVDRLETRELLNSSCHQARCSSLVVA